MHLQALDRAATRLSTKPGAESHSTTISTLSVQQLLFYSYYVFRPHHDKTMFKPRRCKTPNLPSIWLHALPAVTLTGILTTLGDKTTPSTLF